MRQLLAALLAFPALAWAAPQVVTFYGQITSFERYESGAWVAASLPDNSMQLVARPFSDLLATATCPTVDHCGNQMLLDGVLGWSNTWLTFGTTTLSPDQDNPCTGSDYCSPYDPFSIARLPDGHYGNFGDQLQHDDGTEIRFGQVLWNILGPQWIPDGPIGLGALYGLDGAIDGSGSFASTVRRNGVTQEGSYRGTFTLSTAYVPTPGTLALLGLGALGLAMRRRFS